MRCAVVLRTYCPSCETATTWLFLAKAPTRTLCVWRSYGDNQYRFMLMCLAALEAPLNLPLQARPLHPADATFIGTLAGLNYNPSHTLHLLKHPDTGPDPDPDPDPDLIRIPAITLICA